MKKIIALAIAVLMLAALAVPAFAAAATPPTETQIVPVTYSVDETFTVTIPASIEMTAAATKDVAISVENLNMKANRKFVVSPTAAIIDMTTNSIAEDVTIGFTTVEWTANQLEANTKNIVASWGGGAAPTVAGDYSGEVTFTAGIVDVAPQG